MKDESPLTGGRLLLQQLRPVRAASVVALLAALAGVAATLAGPLLIQRFVDRAGAGADESALKIGRAHV